ncbi:MULTISPECIES: single-stranded DNA-binding protein [unclassified Corynebacterium]|jgi:single-strand binding protein|uniref:single-stranded DNA-binding protein n=1 Tax=Corynebacterium TaxID=1716 RepID=UPI00254DDBFE|nr:MULTISPECIES: single-stranded DNA-binding protein [unclassified Corynebacterium]MDK8453035.1 single-stranded DNA-binding protein [Corynebacterium sp. MSK084]MDK8468212.1 single-stranded DNA-binding protein [Corynebacterium sp. MSK130]MDK8477153.1 single-stranded DNA-binding protein [Corynebacterium sp. MSK310]MDK8492599.1 single-stranded DNA-binding protein [Corynebacterium sp. MSK175]MDK8514953.1 single-stranded DNA-binding protein [Corynebacterium sp. MSK123]
MAQGDTNITVVGNIVADPELRFTPAGAAVANFRVASTPRRYNSQTNQWEDGEAMFLTCNVWRQAAENVAETLSKGMRIIVTGRLKQRSFQTREGENRTVFEIDVDEVGPSLRYATAQVNRNPREGGGNFGGGGQQQRSNNNNQGGFGGQQQQQSQQQNQAPAEDPWNSAPPAGGFGGADSEPPF